MPDKFGMFYLQWSNPLAPINGFNFNSNFDKNMTDFLKNQNLTIQNLQQLEKWQERLMINDMQQKLFNTLTSSAYPLNIAGFNFIPSEEKMAQSYEETSDSTKNEQKQNAVEK